MLNRFLRHSRILGFKGVVAGLMGKITGRPQVALFHQDNIAHPISLRMPSSDADAYEQIFLQNQYKFEVATPPEVIVDAGANIGLASVYFANRFPLARIFAIECERSNFELLQVNIKPYKNIVPIHAALWNELGQIQIVDPGLGEWGFMTVARSEDSVGHSCVRALTLDSIMSEHRISHIDILKIDIEGAEFEVFNSSSSWIASVDTIIAELHDRLKPGCEHSFAVATGGFSQRWRQGENVYVSKSESCVIR